MFTNLQSTDLHIAFDATDGLFNIWTDSGSFNLTGCRMRLEVGGMNGKRTLPLAGWHLDDETPINLDSPHGLIQPHVYRLFFDDPGLEVSVTFAIAPKESMVMWKIGLLNKGAESIWIEKIEFLRVGGQRDFGEISIGGESETDRLAFFSNGWQSWSTTGAYQADQAMRISRLGFLQQPMIINHGTPALRVPGYFSSDFFGALTNRQNGDGFVIGFLSQLKHFGSIEAVLFDRPSLALWTSDRCRLDPDCTLETDWAVVMPLSPLRGDPLSGYLEAVSREYGLEEHGSMPVPAGWCSWYHYYSNLTEQDLHVNLQSLETHRDELPLDLVQIDDGFESNVGDWFRFKPGFPNGMSGLAREISALGKTPGLWLAPFILDRRSDFYHEHPEFVLRSRRGNPVNAGFGWNGLTAAFDLTVPGALEAACEAAKAATFDWGYPYLKLDFLYAAALLGRYYDPTKTRAQVMRLGMQSLRDAVKPGTYLLGCGMPLGSGIGLVDANRISCDVNSSWEPRFPGIPIHLKNEPSVPSVRNALQNILTRAPMHNRWWVNDPDCLLLRPDTRLTLAEIQTMATAIGITGGSLLISDDLTRLPKERLAIAEAILPVLGKRAEVLDILINPTPQTLRLNLTGQQGSWTIAARFNWLEEPQSWVFSPADFGLDEKPYWISSFWDNQIFFYQPGESLAMPGLSRHGSALLGIYPHPEQNTPVYLGGNLHFSQGGELTAWSVSDRTLRITLELGRHANGFVRLFLPIPPISAHCGAQPITWTKESENIYRFMVTVNQTVEINVSY